ncbi:MAG: aminocarboxymuconate-semialdehyde decarboxylase [Alphaproteobacteria bacterium]|jgi:aminocarboxymuconate-semialdehyde decarboxylase
MTIDVHAHFVPPAIMEDINQRGAGYGVSLVEHPPGCHCCKFENGQQIRPFFETILSVDRRIEAMDRQEVDREILSVWADIFGYSLPPRQGAEWHRVLNDNLARIAEGTPERFSWMASGALQDAALAAKELERCKAAGAVGTIVAANVCGENLGDCPLDEFWAACEALDMPVFIHPALPVSEGRARNFGLNQICAYTGDTTLTIGSMILSGVFERYPKLDMVLSHGGGTLPFLIGRFDRMHATSDRKMTGDVAAKPPSEYLRQFHYDTILNESLALQFLKKMVGIDRILIGTDEPFPVGDPDPLTVLRAAGFSADELDQIGEKNPRALYRGL